MMDWCYELDTEDFLVPKGEEMLDMFPLPDSLPQWGINGSQSFGCSRNFDPLKRTDLPDEKSHQKMVFGKANGQISFQESVHPNGFTITDGWSQDPWCGNTMVHDCPDFQFNHLTRNDQMDDIFLSSLLKEDPPATEDDNAKSSRLSSETWFSSMPADDNSTDLMFDSESVSGAIQSTGSSKNFRKCAESPSVEWETVHATTSSVSNSTNSGRNDHSIVKGSESKLLHPSYQKHPNGRHGNGESGCIEGGISLEESVLHDLEATMTQLSKNTRLCFRDSLYRLANNSIQQMSLQGQVRGQAMDELPEMEADDERIRSSKTETAESETNTIDRAVANFVFQKADVNTQDLLPVMSAAKHKHKAVEETKGSSNCISFGPPQIFQHPPT